MKSTKSEEFLIHRRSVSPVGSPSHAAAARARRRGASVDLSAAARTHTPTIGRRTLSKEWSVLTTTTHEEVTVIHRPPAATAHVDASTATPGLVPATVRSTVDHDTSDGGDSSGSRLYRTAIDNIRLSVGGPSADAAATSQLAVVPGPGETRSGDPSCQLDDLISSLIDISAVDAQRAQSLQPSVRHGVVSTARY